MILYIERASLINAIPGFRRTTGCDGHLVYIVYVRCLDYSVIMVYRFPSKVKAIAVERDSEQNMLAKCDSKVFSYSQLNGLCYFNNVWN